MMLRWVVATAHLLALPLGLGAVWARSRALASVESPTGLGSAFAADTVWGLAAALWITTGLSRAFGGLEKGTDYYLHDRVFYVKMGLFLAVLLLEIRPMITLLRWRSTVRRGGSPDTTAAPALARISRIQAGLVIITVFAATALARGW